MINVCHVGFGYYPGKLAVMYEYSRCQARQGLNVYVIGMIKDGSINVQDVEGVKFFPFSAESDSVRSPQKLSFLWHTSRILSTLSCDIIHVYASLGIFLLPLLSRRSQSKSVWIYDIRSGPVHPGLTAWVGRKALSVESRFFDTVFCQSEGTREMIFGEGREDIFIARQGVDMNLFQPMPQTPAKKKLNIPEDEFVLIFVGALHPARKIEILLEAFQIVCREATQPVRLMMVGDGSDFGRLSGLSREMGLASHITFTGFIKFQKVSAYLAAADIGLAYVPDTAEYGPQPPLKTAEMLACGLPVIATNTRGNRHFIRDGFNGVLCDDNPPALAAAIQQLIADPSAQERLRSVARESVRPYHYETIVGDQLIPEYKKLLGQ